jgi:hypothetical protein
MGHSMGSDVSRGNITSALAMDALRPISNALADYYVKLLGV